MKRCEKCQCTWTAPVEKCPECGSPTPHDAVPLTTRLEAALCAVRREGGIYVSPQLLKDCLSALSEIAPLAEKMQERLTVEALEFYQKHPNGIPQHVTLSMLDELLLYRTSPKKQADPSAIAPTDEAATLLKDLELFVRPRDDGHYEQAWDTIKRVSAYLSTPSAASPAWNAAMSSSKLFAGAVFVHPKTGCDHLWQGPGATPPSWVCLCGTKCYRSYEDYVDD